MLLQVFTSVTTGRLTTFPLPSFGAGVIENQRWDAVKKSNIPLYPVYTGDYFD